MKRIDFTHRIVLLHFFAMVILVCFSSVYFQISLKTQIEESELQKATQIAENLANSVPAFIELGLISDVKVEVGNVIKKTVALNLLVSTTIKTS